jgi:hypothetical protein
MKSMFLDWFLSPLDAIKLADIPTKHDGTADMRYTESREALSSGLISKDEVIEGKRVLSNRSRSHDRQLLFVLSRCHGW